jgi:hypothetical protein
VQPQYQHPGFCNYLVACALGQYSHMLCKASSCITARSLTHSLTHSRVLDLVGGSKGDVCRPLAGVGEDDA